jgi:hypothetical protein
VDLVDTKIKIIIIIVLKLDLKADYKQELDHDSSWLLTQVNIKIKKIIIIIFKVQLGSRIVVRLRSRVKLTINSGQHNNKNDYYYSFKT